VAVPTTAFPPGIYVTKIILDPPEPKSNELVQFSVVFHNTTGQPQTYRWFIKIFAPEQKNSFGETPKNTRVLPPGQWQLKGEPNWKTGTFFGCLFFTARVFWVNDDNQVFEFLSVDGKSVGKDFTVCP
jgi:hypothetical protein